MHSCVYCGAHEVEYQRYILHPLARIFQLLLVGKKRRGGGGGVACVLTHEGRQNAVLLCCTGGPLYKDRQCRVLTTSGCTVQWFHSVHASPAAGCAVSGAAVLARTVSYCHRGRTVELAQQPTENETAAGRLLAPLHDLQARNKTRPERWSGYADTQSLIHRLSSFLPRACFFFFFVRWYKHVFRRCIRRKVSQTKELVRFHTPKVLKLQQELLRARESRNIAARQAWAELILQVGSKYPCCHQVNKR